MSKSNKKKAFYSYHIFLFPFKWKMDDSLSNRLNLENISNQFLDTNEWERQFITDELPDEETYNEFMYFHPFAQEALYDRKDNDNIRQLVYTPSDESLAAELDNRKSVDLLYEIELLNGKKYALNIDKIHLNIYGTGIGILSFHLINYHSDELHSFLDVLNINSFGRRIYPSVLGLNHNEEVSSNQSKVYDLLPDAISLKKISKINSANEIWKASKEKFEVDSFKNKFDPPNFISCLFPKDFFDSYQVTQILDDRMYTMSWCAAGNDIIKPKLTNEHTDAFLTSNLWYKYLFVDGATENSVANDLYRQNLLKRHSYTRWAGYGTLYGITRYSFMTLLATDNSSGDSNWLSTHHRTMYYKMVELCLMQRASLLKFSKRIADITHEANPEENAKKTARLNKDYLHFINNIHFTEISPQEQGINLYNMLQDHLEIDRDRVELNQEIQELHNYMNILAEAQHNEAESRRNKALETLTLIGALLVLPSFLFGYYGLGILGEGFNENWAKKSIIIGLIFLIVFFSYRYNALRENAEKKGMADFMFGGALISSLFALLVPFSFQLGVYKSFDKSKEVSVDTIRIGQPILIPIDSTQTIELNPDNFYFIQPKKQ